MTVNRMGIPVLVFLFVLSGYGAAVSSTGFSDRDLSVNQSNISDSSVPDNYRAGMEPVRIGIAIPETLIPGPKGEMQAGPRSIGFDLVSLFISIIIALLLITPLIWVARKEAMAGMPGNDPDDRIRESAGEEERR